MTDVASVTGLRKLWMQTLGDPRVGIAVLDGPVDGSHPCFAGAELTQLEPLFTGFAKDGFAGTAGVRDARTAGLGGTALPMGDAPARVVGWDEMITSSQTLGSSSS